MPAGSLLPVAVRGYTVRRKEAEPADSARRGQWKFPSGVLVFDTETTTDRSQRLNFGSWRYYRVGWDGAGPPEMACVEEGLFYADDLPERYPTGYEALLDYRARHGPAVSWDVPDAAWRLELMSAHEFVNEVLHPLAYRGRAWIVGFNLPFDLSRVAYHWSESRDYLSGGFSLVLEQYLTEEGEWREHPWRSRVAVKTIDSKRRLMGFKRPAEVDAVDQIPEGEREPDPKRAPRGHFLDLRTLAFALTNESYSLKRACKDFGVSAGKTEAEDHGAINRAYIDYNRRDVEATGALFANLLAEYRRHPIKLQPTKAFSPASIGKAYLRAMGVQPRLQRQRDFSREVLGKGMVAYYGGRAECRIHPEPKSLAPNGKPAGWHGNGLLGRRPVTATRLVHVGKESNELEDKQAGVVHDPEEAINEHVAEDAWFSLVLPVLQRMPRSALRKQLSGTRISALRAGTLDPGRKAEISLTKVAGDFARDQLRKAGIVPAAHSIDRCAAYLHAKVTGFPVGTPRARDPRGP